MKKLLLILLCLPIIGFAQVQCTSGDCVNGKGTLLYLKSGNTYQGDFLNGVQTGVGTFTFRDDSSQYIGDFKNGYFHGEGTHTYPTSGSIAIGTWENDRMNGYGVKSWSSGAKYEGYWKDGNRNGQGTFTWDSGEWEGDKYVGEWKDNKKDGQGTYTYSYGAQYIGQYENDTPHGFGIYMYPTNSEKLKEQKYIGYWENGKMHGKGTLYWNGDLTWTGVFKEGKRFEGFFNNDNQYLETDIIGDSLCTSVILTKSSSGLYNMKIGFNDFKDDFILDLGASEIYFNRPYLDKLIKNGVNVTPLNIYSYASDASQDDIEIEFFSIDGLVIGDYVINNIIVAVAANVRPLIGMGMLNKFNKWTISSNNTISLCR